MRRPAEDPALARRGGTDAGPTAESGATLVVVNRRAGGGRGGALEPRLRSALAAARPAAQIVAGADAADAAGALAAVAALPAGSRVVVVGGDGTLNALLPALIAGGHVTGLLPVGSGNDSARALGLHGLPWRRVLELALAAPARTIDTGLVRTEHSQRPFVSSVCIGLDAAIARRAATGHLRALGSAPRYLLAALVELLRLRRHRLQIDADGRRIYAGEALLCAVLNTPSYGGGLPMQPAARLDDGRLDAVVAAATGRAGALALLLRLLRARHLGHRRVRDTAFAALHVEADTALPLACDGEALADACCVDVEVRPQSLRVVGIDSEVQPALQQTPQCQPR
jgi:diacylglycerol kinase family enzyme